MKQCIGNVPYHELHWGHKGDNKGVADLLVPLLEPPLVASDYSYSTALAQCQLWSSGACPTAHRSTFLSRCSRPVSCWSRTRSG